MSGCFPLLAKNIEVSSLTLEKPKIELIRNEAGVWNFATLGQKPASAPAAPAGKPVQPATQPAAQPGAFQLSKLAISDGQIAVTDYQKHQSRAVYDHIDLTLKDYAPNQPFALDVAAHLPGNGNRLWNSAARVGR